MPWLYQQLKSYRVKSLFVFLSPIFSLFSCILHFPQVLFLTDKFFSCSQMYYLDYLNPFFFKIILISHGIFLVLLVFYKG